MALKKKPVTGMKDMLPKEMEIRDYVIQMIKDTYKTFGFTSIETPCVEHIENLCSKQGGDNEKLIFKILKRGEKLKIEEAKEEKDYIDGYDLDVDKLVFGEILISMPGKTLCTPDCKGLCSICGHNLNISECGCDRESLDPRMSVFKDILKNFKEV
mgnify:CR=1 FL=1